MVLLFITFYKRNANCSNKNKYEHIENLARVFYKTDSLLGSQWVIYKVAKPKNIIRNILGYFYLITDVTCVRCTIILCPSELFLMH
jgi:hypothetical protein